MAQTFPSYANTLAKLSLICAAGAPFAVFYAGSTISRSPANTKVGVPLDQPVPFSHKHHAYELGIDCRYCHWNVEKGAVAGVPGAEVCMSCHSQIWTNSPLLQPLRDSYATNKPIVWQKVNKVPDFVYFDHSIHVARGINCNQCHGPVTKMQLTYKGQYFAMAWCLECHREPERFLGSNAQDGAPSPHEGALVLYEKAMRGDRLSVAEFNLLNGKEHAATPEEIAKGRRLVESYEVKTEQLEDCWTCHR
jgi:hypothetical protein